MDTRKTGVELDLELASKSAKIEYRENPTFWGKLDFLFWGFYFTIVDENRKPMEDVVYCAE